MRLRIKDKYNMNVFTLLISACKRQKPQGRQIVSSYFSSFFMFSFLFFHVIAAFRTWVDLFYGLFLVKKMEFILQNSN